MKFSICFEIFFIVCNSIFFSGFLVNQHLKTVAVIDQLGNFLDVRIYEYTLGEEYSADTIASGIKYGEWYVHLDTGEIQKLDFSNDD